MRGGAPTPLATHQRVYAGRLCTHPAHSQPLALPQYIHVLLHPAAFSPIHSTRASSRAHVQARAGICRLPSLLLPSLPFSLLPRSAPRASHICYAEHPWCWGMHTLFSRSSLPRCSTSPPLSSAWTLTVGASATHARTLLQGCVWACARTLPTPFPSSDLSTPQRIIHTHTHTQVSIATFVLAAH